MASVLSLKQGLRPVIAFIMKNKPKALIQLENITKTYTNGDIITSVLNQLSLTINTGEMLAILGTSGSGKSTLMNIIGLLDQDYLGEYWLFEAKTRIKDLDDQALARLRNQTIGFVFQQFHLLPRLTALQNVLLPLHYRGLSEQQSQALAIDALARVDMENMRHRRPLQLSGGQQQRVAIARALVGDPAIILADEPTGALDSQTSQIIMDLFHTLHDEGRTLILITHEQQVAAQCQRQIILTDGQIILDQRS